MNRPIKALSLLLALILLLTLIPVSVMADTSLSISKVNALVDQSSTQIRCEVTVTGVLPEGAKNASINVENFPSSALESSSVTSKAIAGAGTYTLYYPIRSDVYNDSYTISFIVSYESAEGDLVRSSVSADSFNIEFGKDRPTWDGTISSDTDSSKLQSVYDITIVPTEIAKDDSNHKVDLQLHLAYKGDKNFQNAPLSYFRIEPVVSGVTTEFPFKLEYSSYGKTMADLTVVKDKDGNVTDTYFDFPFTVKSDAVNGYYPISFKIYHLYQNTNLQETDPKETTLTTYVEIRNGKKASSSTDTTAPSIDPSTAILLLDGYTLSPEKITAGEEFDLTLNLRNTSDKAVTDVKSTLTEANRTITPVNSTSSFFIDKIGAGETVSYTMHLKAEATAGVTPVALTLANAFVQEKTAKSSSDTFTIPVTQVANLSLDPPSYSVEVMSGDSTNLSMKFYNKGKSLLYNVSVSLESESLQADENYYAGNMESGSSKTYDVMVTPADGFEGLAEGNIVVSYEDADGNITEKRTPISITVASYNYEDDYSYIEEDTEAETETSSGIPSWIWFALGGAVVVAGAVVLIVVLRKRKKAQVDDDEMD